MPRCHALKSRLYLIPSPPCIKVEKTKIQTVRANLPSKYRRHSGFFFTVVRLAQGYHDFRLAQGDHDFRLAAELYDYPDYMHITTLSSLSSCSPRPVFTNDCTSVLQYVASQGNLKFVGYTEQRQLIVPRLS